MLFNKIEDGITSSLFEILHFNNEVYIIIIGQSFNDCLIKIRSIRNNNGQGNTFTL